MQICNMHSVVYYICDMFDMYTYLCACTRVPLQYTYY